MKISDRLVKIASFIKKGANVADIGADHGLLEKYLLDNKIVESVFAIENKRGPYEILKNNLKDYNVILSLSDGIEAIPSDIDTVVIAGMGGNLIVDILKKNVSKLENVEQIVVDAHKDLELVRREIVKLGYVIEKENIVLENSIYYFVISLVKGKATYDDITYEWGLNIKRDPLFDEYRNKEIQRLSKNLESCKASSKISEAEIKTKEEKIRRLTLL